MPNERRDGALPSCLTAWGVSECDLDHASQRFVVRDAFVAADRCRGALMDVAGEAYSDRMNQVADWRRRRERIGHEREADFGETDVERRVADRACGPIDKTGELFAVGEHVRGP